MVDQDSGDEVRDYPGAPRWAKVFAIIVAVPVLLFVILMLVGGHGRHGPSRHFGPDGAGDSAASSVRPEHVDSAGHTPPSGR